MTWAAAGRAPGLLVATGALVLAFTTPAHAISCQGVIQTDINNAASGDTVTVDPPGHVCALTSGLTISGKTITLQGVNGAILDGASAGPHMLTLDGARTTIVRDLTLRNGNSGSDGAAVVAVNDSAPTMERLQLYGNSADAGGAVAVEPNSTHASEQIVVRDSIFGSTASGGANAASVGGAMRVSGSHPVEITGSQFINNSADSAGALELLTDAGVAVTVASNTFSGNTAKTTGGAVHLGCGIKTFTGNTLTGNQVADPSGSSSIPHRGGALSVITCGDSDPLNQSGNLFSGNSVSYSAASANLAAGGGEFAGAEVITSRNDRFVGNRVQVPGASDEAEGSGLALEGCGPGVLQGNHRVESLVAAGNSFTGEGAGERNGAVYAGCSSGSVNLTVLDSTIAGNDAGGSGTAGLFGGADDTLTMHNSIVADNFGGADLSGFATKTVDYSDACPLLAGAGNFCASPLLVNATAGDVHQTAGSPTRDKGSNAQVPADLTSDFEGQARIQGPVVDIGADEASFAVADTSPPVVSNPTMAKQFAVSGKPTAINARKRKRRRVKRGTTIRYSLTEAATVSLRIDRRLKGRKVKKRCKKPTRRNRKHRRCTRLKKAGTLTRRSVAGRNSVKFSGRIGRKALKRARYRLTITATDAAGNKSRPRRLNFRIVKP